MQEVKEEVEKELKVEEEGEKSADPALVATEFKTVTLAGEKLIKDLKIKWMMFFYRTCLDKARLGGQNKLKQKCLEKRFFFYFFYSEVFCNIFGRHGKIHLS